MTQTIVIAEMNNNAVHPSTAELVSAAMTIGGAPTIVVPCTDAGQAGGAANMGGANIIAVKSMETKSRRRFTAEKPCKPWP